MPALIPIQEKAYNNINITINPVNFRMVTISYEEYYNYNPNTSEYTGSGVINIVLPVTTISCTYQYERNSIDEIISTSLVIKNVENSVCVWNSNDWYLPQGYYFSTENLANLFNTISDLPTA